MSLNSQRAVALLARYVSPNTASGIVRGVSRELGLDPDRFADTDVARFVDALASGARPFISGDRALELRTQLLNAANTRARRNQVFPVRTEHEVSVARLGARELCMEAGAASVSAQQVATGVSEVARNIFMYAGSGYVELTLRDSARRAIAVRAVDQGPGIADVEAILAGTYRSETGQGRGIAGIRRVAYRFDLRTGPTGTTLEFEMWL